MSVAVLNASAREETGKNRIIKERKQGNIPAVVYSRGKSTQAIYLNERDLEKILFRYGSSTKIALDFQGEKTYAIIKEIQRDTLKNKLIHVDLQTLDENEKFRLTMPINILNKEIIESATEIVQVQLQEVSIQTYPKYLPEKIEIDAAKLKERDNLTLQDLNIANDENIEILDDLNSTVATKVYASKQEEREEELDPLSI